MTAEKPSHPAPPPPPSRRTNALEHLYVYWLLSTALLLLALVLSIAYMHGLAAQLTHEHHRALTEREERVAALGERVTELAKRVAEMENAAAPPATAPPPATTPAGVSPPRAPSPPQPSASGQAPVVPSQQAIQARLRRTLVPGAATPYEVPNRAEAEQLVALALQNVTSADWSGATWAQLAILARLNGDNVAAEKLAVRAYHAGDSLAGVAEVAARALLAAGRPGEAQPHARHFLERTQAAPRARVLLSRVLLALDDYAGADEAVWPITDTTALLLADQLALARACVSLQHWSRLTETIAHVRAAPPALEAERNFLQAVALIQANERLAEALAILDYLAEQRRQPAPATRDRYGADPPASPEPYEIATWRGVAYMGGQQTASARQALDAAVRLRPDRPEAYYWRSQVEISDKQFETAQAFLRKALATSDRYAPAWESLGRLALQADDPETAALHLERAVAGQPRRAAAQFLLAVAQTRLGHKEKAAAALRQAALLNPAYGEQIRQSEQFARLFTPAELAELTAPLTPDDTAAPSPRDADDEDAH